MFKLIKNN